MKILLPAAKIPLECGWLASAFIFTETIRGEGLPAVESLKNVTGQKPLGEVLEAL